MRARHVPWEQLGNLANTKIIHGEAACADPDKLAKILRQTGLFDPQHYLAAYPDVAQADIDPLEHYAKYGWKEKRNPAIWFDNLFYTNENFEVDFTKQDPFLHFIGIGYAEGRRPNQYKPKKRGRLIVSIAVAPETMESAAAALQSLLKQTRKPDKILVYLPYSLSFPKNLLLLASPSLEFHWRQDLGPYNMLMHALEEHPDDIVVTCAPWLLYTPNWLNALYESHKARPECLHCIRGAKAQFGDGELKVTDHQQQDTEPDLFNMPASAYGLLIPPGKLKTAPGDQDSFMRHAPDYIDAWIWAKALAQGIPTVICGREGAVVGQRDDASGASVRGEMSTRKFLRQVWNCVISMRKNIEKQCSINVFAAFLQKPIINQYKKFNNKELKLDECESFSEKLYYMKIYDDNPIYSIIADKYLVREWIAAKLGNRQYQPELYGIWDDFDDINFTKLPNEFILKPNHLSGCIKVVRDKNKLDLTKLRGECVKLLKINYSFMFYEMFYFDMPPRIICEEFLGENINDYKFLCFNGDIAYCWVDRDRYKKHQRNFYTKDWTPLDVTMDYPKNPDEVARPECLDLMQAIAKKLSLGMPHMRVDFFIAKNGDPKVGELTLMTDAGNPRFSNEAFSRELGARIDLSLCKAQYSCTD